MTDDNYNAIETLEKQGYLVSKITLPSIDIPDKQLYQPFVNSWATYSPWLADDDVENIIQKVNSMGKVTLVNRDRLWMLKSCFQQTLNINGEVWETGVYQGGTALLLRQLIINYSKPGNPTRLRLFDTFSGMPPTRDDIDLHKAGDFSDTSLESVRSLVGDEPWIDFHAGLVPQTFSGLEQSKIKFAHIDLDVFDGILAACEFIYSRIAPGGIMVFDDYGFWTCPGARKAVDIFFSDKPEIPIVMPTGQAIVSILPRN